MNDLRYAIRGLIRTPGFTIAAVLTLALGIGANTAIFSFVEAVVLRTLPVSNPHELRFIVHGQADRPSTSSNYPYFERLRDRTDVFSGLTVYSTATFKVRTGEGIELTRGQFASGNYHHVLGVPMTLGRGFTSDDDRAGARAASVVISDAYWTRKFGRDPNVLGREIVIADRRLPIVGVTAAGFNGLEPGRPADITVPLAIMALDSSEDVFNMHDSWRSMPLVARIKPGITDARASAAVDAVFQQYLSEPENQWFRGNSTRRASVAPAERGTEIVRSQYSTALWVLMGIVAAVLLIACVNVANLLLARNSARAKEVAIRLSVGAGRGRLVRQFLIESLVLACAGAVVGLAFATWGTQAISTVFQVGRFPLVLDVQPNGAVLAFAVAVSMAAAIAFGLGPAFAGTRVSLIPALKESPAAPARRRSFSGRQVLIASQIALCMILVAGAGLLIRSLRNLENVEAGFDRRNVLMFSLSLEGNGTQVSDDKVLPLCQQVLDRLRGDARVQAAACSSSIPVDTGGNQRGLRVPGRPAIPNSGPVFSNMVTSDYFRAFGIQLTRGRAFDPQDSAGSEQVAVVNQSLATFYFGSDDPLGRTIRFGSDDAKPMTIIGVVNDTTQQSLRLAPPRTVYSLLSQAYEPESSLTVAIRTRQEPSGLMAAVRSEARAVSPAIVVDYIRTMEQQIEHVLVRERVLATLSTWFGVLALVLACVGLYGVMAFDVSRRRRELGIRVALGAQPSQLLRRVVGRSSAVVLAGIAIGLALTLATTRVLSTLLFGVGDRDPATLAMAAGLLAATALLAAYLPARRAGRVNPVAALRYE